MTLVIRDAVAKESQHLSDMTMRSKAHWGYSDLFMDACRDELFVSPEKINDSKFEYSVAVQDDIVVGYYAIQCLSDEEYELDALFVEPEFIGMGMGWALLEHAKQRVVDKGGKEMTIQGDPNAENFYRSAGGDLTGKKESGSIPGRFLPTFKIYLGDEAEGS